MEHKVINWKKNLVFVWLSQLLTLAGFSAAMPFIPIYMRTELGITDEAARGFWVSMFYFFGMLSFSIFTPLWGIVADKYGRKLMLLRAGFVSAILLPLMVLAPNVYILVLLRFISCIFSGTVNAAQTLLVTNTPQERHGLALGTLSSAVWSGTMIGYLVGGFVVHYFGYFWAFMLCGALFAVGSLLVLFFVEENFTPVVKVKSTVPKKFGLPNFSASVWMILFLFFFMALARRFDEPFLAMQIETVNGMEKAAFYTGLISTAAAAGGILSGVFIGYMCDKFAPDKIALPAIIVAALATVVQGAATNLTMLGIGRFVAFFAAGGLEPIILTLLARVSPDNRKGEIFGWSSSMRSIGLLAGSPLGGLVIVFFKTRGVFFAGATALAMLIPLFMIVLKKVNILTMGNAK